MSDQTLVAKKELPPLGQCADPLSGHASVNPVLLGPEGAPEPSPSRLPRVLIACGYDFCSVAGVSQLGQEMAEDPPCGCAWMCRAPLHEFSSL